MSRMCCAQHTEELCPFAGAPDRNDTTNARTPGGACGTSTSRGRRKKGARRRKGGATAKARNRGRDRSCGDLAACIAKTPCQLHGTRRTLSEELAEAVTATARLRNSAGGDAGEVMDGELVFAPDAEVERPHEAGPCGSGSVPCSVGAAGGAGGLGSDSSEGLSDEAHVFQHVVGVRGLSPAMGDASSAAESRGSSHGGLMHSGTDVHAAHAWRCGLLEVIAASHTADGEGGSQAGVGCELAPGAARQGGGGGGETGEQAGGSSAGRSVLTKADNSTAEMRVLAALGHPSDSVLAVGEPAAADERAGGGYGGVGAPLSSDAALEAAAAPGAAKVSAADCETVPNGLREGDRCEQDGREGPGGTVGGGGFNAAAAGVTDPEALSGPSARRTQSVGVAGGVCQGAVAVETSEATPAAETAASMSDVGEEKQGDLQSACRGCAAEATGAKGEAESHGGMGERAAGPLQTSSDSSAASCGPREVDAEGDLQGRRGSADAAHSHECATAMHAPDMEGVTTAEVVGSAGGVEGGGGAGYSAAQHSAAQEDERAGVMGVRQAHTMDVPEAGRERTFVFGCGTTGLAPSSEGTADARPEMLPDGVIGACSNTRLGFVVLLLCSRYGCSSQCVLYEAPRSNAYACVSGSMKPGESLYPVGFESHA